MENKPKLVVFGSSHATRLLRQCQENSKLNNKYQIVGNTKPGTTWFSLNVNWELLLDLTDKDLLVVQFLGNDLLKKNIQITQNPHIFHLYKFEPKSDTYVNLVRKKLKELLAQVKAEIVIIDDPYRHLSCCTQHSHHGGELLRYLTKRNRELKRFFSEYTVLDHRKIITSYSNRRFRHMATYRSMFVDTVHLHDKFYAEWAESLAQMYCN
jgi:lysophospholipase L1-like esterase